MRTTLDIDRKLLEEIVALTGEKNMGRAVNQALAAFVRRRRLGELQALAGQIELEDNLKELEELEIRRLSRTDW